MAIISVRDLVVEYDGRRVLNGLNLDIEHGETMVLLGGSGSGKSTLLRQIIGLERPKSGSIHIQGMDITRCSKSELKKIHRSIGVAFQSAALFNSLTVEDNVALPLREHTRLAPSIIDLGVDEAGRGRSRGVWQVTSQRTLGWHEEARGRGARARARP